MRLKRIHEHELIGKSFPLLRKEKAYSMPNGLQKYIDEGVEVMVKAVYRGDEFSTYMDWTIVSANGSIFRIPVEELMYHYNGQEEVNTWRAVYDEMICE
jgi:hypothetical protein